MSKKAPDTRNKLDNNRGNRPQKPGQKKNVGKRPKPKVITAEDLKKIHEDHSSEAIKLKLEKKPSKGSIFKKEHGHSKTMKRLMRKHHVSTLEEYKPIRKRRKLEEKKIRQKKHHDSVTYKRLNGKSKKKTQPVKKEKKKK